MKLLMTNDCDKSNKATVISVMTGIEWVMKVGKHVTGNGTHQHFFFCFRSEAIHLTQWPRFTP